MPLQLPRVGDQIIDSNFLRLGSLLIDTGGRAVGIRFGTTTLTFTASTNSATVTVSHGLGAVPAAVVVTSKNTGGFGSIPNCSVFNILTASFDIAGEIKTAKTGTETVTWIAIG